MVSVKDVVSFMGSLLIINAIIVVLKRVVIALEQVVARVTALGPYFLLSLRRQGLLKVISLDF